MRLGILKIASETSLSFSNNRNPRNSTITSSNEKSIAIIMGGYFLEFTLQILYILWWVCGEYKLLYSCRTLEVEQVTAWDRS